MKRFTKLSTLALLLVMLMLVTACTPTKVEEVKEEPQTTEQQVEVSEEDVAEEDSEKEEDVKEEVKEDTTADGIVLTDMAGREVKLDGPAKKIVVLTPSDCEILYAINAGDSVIGRGTYCDYPEEVQSVKELTSGAETNIEEIIALEPDVVIMSMMSQTEEHVEAIEKAGIKVIVSDASNIGEVFTAIKMIGIATDNEGAAENLIKEMQSTFDEYKQKAQGKDGGSIYFEVSPLEFGLWTAGKNTFMDEIAEIIGVKNAFEDVNGWSEISEEQVIERNPDHIATITMYFGEGPKPDEEIMGRNGWEGINAVANESVFMANSDEFSRPGPRLSDAVKALYEFIYEK